MKTIFQFLFAIILIGTCTLPSKGQEKAKKQEIQIRVDGEKQDTTYQIQVVTEEDGIKNVYGKTYNSLKEMQSDSALAVQVSGDKIQTFDIRIGSFPADFDWFEAIDSAGHKVIKSEGGNFVIMNVDEEDTREHMLKYFSDADSGGTVHSYEIKVIRNGDPKEGQEEIAKEIVIRKGGSENLRDLSWDTENETKGSREKYLSSKIFKSEKYTINKASIEDISATDKEFTDFQVERMPELSLKSIHYYPNPNEGEFTLTFQGAKKPVVIRILDTKGNLMYESEEKDFDGNYNHVINVKDFKKGTYLLQIYQQGKVLNRKLTLE
jgi:hypothetical protein